MENNKLTYQTARRLRGERLRDIFADQLIMGEGYGAGIKNAVSLKLRAKLTGIKEKFDPLNIAKFLTFGSRLGPAILGKMTGRSRRDIEYFTGRARPVSTRDTKLGMAGEMGGGGGSSVGLQVVLSDILTFLQKSHNDDMILREKENNLREGAKLEDEKRHKKLLKALGAVPGKQTATPVKSKQGGLFDNFMEHFKKMLDDLKESLKWVDGLKWATKVAGWAQTALGAISAEMFLSMLPIAAFLAPFILSAAEKDKIRENPNAPQYKDNPFAMMLRGEAKSEGQAAQINRRATVKQYRRNEVKDFVDAGFTDEELKKELGADKKTLEVWLKEHPDKASMWQAPVEPISGTNVGAKPVGNMSQSGYHGEDKPAVKGDTVENAAAARSEAAKNDPRLIKSDAKPIAAPVPVVAPASAAVSAKTTENVKLNLESTAPAKTEIAEKTTNNYAHTSQEQIRYPSIPAVRNLEDSFLSMIMGSTRVI
jgi:hypothetical protein